MSPSLLDRRQRSVTGAGLFLLLSLALLGVGARMGTLVEHRDEAPKRLEHQRPDCKQPPFFTLLDRDGRALARSLPTYAVEASPYNLWLGHTPERIVDGIATALQLTPERRAELPALLLDLDENGARRVSRWPLTLAEATDLADWIAEGGPGAGSPLPGFRLESYTPDPRDAQAELLLQGTTGPYFVVEWRPQVALAVETRERLIPGLIDRRGAAALWVRKLAAGLAPHFDGARQRELALLRAQGVTEPPRFYQLASDMAPSRGLAAELRAVLFGDVEPRDPNDWVLIRPDHEWAFDGLMPSRHVAISEVVAVECLAAVRSLIDAEDLSEFQLWMQPTTERVYPLDQSGVVGTWEWLPPVGGSADDVPVLRPSRGLEHLGFTVLRAVEASLASASGATEAAAGEDESANRFDHLVAGQGDKLKRLMLRPRRPGQARDYFVERGDGFEPAELETTLDLELQRYLGPRLQQLVDEHSAALAMAVAVDVDSREVLAVDWRSNYSTITFPPLQHGFTPGSTFKLVTMALALEERVVSSDERLDVGQGRWRVDPPAGVRGRARIIREAEGFARGVITASECVSRSSNAGMVQIGLRVPVEVWKRATADLGYGTPAAPGLLADGLLNLSGRVGEAEGRGGNAWERRRSHASVSFGDSTTVTLLQHVAALSALLDDGAWRPLQFARAVIIDGEREELPADSAVPVVRPDVVANLRAMMRQGALTGTGKDLARPAGLELHSKTGTTEKLAFDVCEHKFRTAHDAARASGADWDDSGERRRLRGDFAPRRSCYCSSIAVMAPDPHGDREVLVLLVVDDPHGDEKFGSKVAGTAAVDVLCRALDLRPPSQAVAVAANRPTVEVDAGSDLPWDPLATAAGSDLEGATW